MTQFKHSADKWPVTIVFALFLLDLVVYLTAESVWLLLGYWLLMIVPKGCISAWNHHHQHASTFRSAVLNRGLELCYALHTGMSTNLWVLHHVLGHHRNYLDQTLDESRWKRLDGRTMGLVEYSVSIAATSYSRAFRVGRSFPRHQRDFLIWTAVALACLSALIYFRPLQGLLVFALPMATCLVFTAWVTYDHHTGLDTDNPFEASFNIMNPWYNRLTGNLGYHTAHHYRQGVHWSQLPELHREIADRIPARCYCKSTFDLLLPGSNPGATSHPPTASAPATAWDTGARFDASR
jgi:fatty acid desaturase